MKIMQKIVNKLKYWLLALFLLPIFSVWICNADKDLLEQIMDSAEYYQTTIHTPSTAQWVWKEVFEEWTRIDVLTLSSKPVPSMVVKVIRLLLSLVVALSVTMILYNWMIYIIQTWQWKEGKNLVKNVVYIVIWIVLSLFSITIITVLQSVSKSLDQETHRDWDRNDDKQVIYTDERRWLLFGLFGEREGLGN